MDKASHSPVVGHGLGRGEVDDDSLRGPCSKQATEDLSTEYTVEVNLELYVKKKKLYHLCKHTFHSYI